MNWKLRRKYVFQRFEFYCGRLLCMPDEEGGEKASGDPDVEEGGVAKLGHVLTDPVVQQKHIEDTEDGI